MSQSTGAGPLPSFDVDNSLSQYNTSPQDWLAQTNGENKYDGLATGIIVFNSDNKVLIIQRASHDSLTNKWEFPGGAADDTDSTIFHAAARELHEESGLIATHFTHAVTQGPGHEPGEVFHNRNRTMKFIRLTFQAEVESCDDVRLDPNEHQDYFWASEDEVREQRSGDKDLAFTRATVQALFIEAFRLRIKRAGAL